MTPHTEPATGVASTGELRLPPEIRACLFDMDGVLTRTEGLHERAWRRALSGFLDQWAKRTGTDVAPYDQVDYDRYIDGKRRLDGVRSFLASRRITLDEGTPDDPAGSPTVEGVGRAKNCIWLQLLEREGAQLEPGAREYLTAAKAAGLWTALVSSSANAGKVVERAGIEALLDVRIDGAVARNENLAGKPAPDTFLAAAARVGVQPAQAAVFEDAVAGVEAGRAGAFGWVVGIARDPSRTSSLVAAGADVVAVDLAALQKGRLEWSRT
jgi:beta-phosphoglucomutase family hydrolase